MSAAEGAEDDIKLDALATWQPEDRDAWVLALRIMRGVARDDPAMAAAAASCVEDAGTAAVLVAESVPVRGGRVGAERP